MKLQVLGCSGGIGDGRHTTALLVNESLLIDAGTGVASLSLDTMCLIQHIFFTHSHLDHVTCMPFLADTVFSRHEAHVELCGLPETLEAVRTHILNGTIWPDFTAIPQDYPLLRYHPIQRGEKVRVGGLEVTVIPVNHSVPGVGYLVDDGRHAFAFSGDTTSNRTFWDALNAHPRLDLLIVEVGFPDNQLPLARISKHYTAGLLAKDVGQLRHKVPLYISHMKPGLEEQIIKECRTQLSGYNLTPLTDGMVFDFS
ncbi:Beta-lactamase family protein [Gammaproteobacteria bacterium]